MHNERLNSTVSPVTRISDSIPIFSLMMNRNVEQNIGLRPLLFIINIICVLFFTGCMWYPYAEDDFSELPDDVFSRLIIKNSTLRTATGGADVVGGVGFAKIDKIKLEKDFEAYFLNKSFDEIINIFNQGNGDCHIISASVYCTLMRRWSLKNTGAPMDTSFWPEPGIKLEFYFEESDQLLAKKVIVNSIDKTKLNYTE